MRNRSSMKRYASVCNFSTLSHFIGTVALGGGRRDMPRPSAVTLGAARRAVKALDLRKALQLEISHELSGSSKFQDQPSGSLGDFRLTWDSSDSRDVVLQKQCKSGEEVFVSALLGEESADDCELPWDVKMKVCIKKPGLSSVLQFDCAVPSKRDDSSKFNIYGAHILPSTYTNYSNYRGPLFSSLDPSLQDGLKEYLEARGIADSLMDFLLLHLHKKEQNQYVNWLQKLEKMV